MLGVRVRAAVSRGGVYPDPRTRQPDRQRECARENAGQCSCRLRRAAGSREMGLPGLLPVRSPDMRSESVPLPLLLGCQNALDR